MTQPQLPLLAPTVPGCVDEIISLNPLTLQCADCGKTERPPGSCSPKPTSTDPTSAVNAPRAVSQ